MTDNTTKRVPHFETDEEAAEFWETHCLTDYLDEAEEVDPDLFRDARLVRVEADGTRTPFTPRPTSAPTPKTPRRKPTTHPMPTKAG